MTKRFWGFRLACWAVSMGVALAGVQAVGRNFVVEASEVPRFGVFEAVAHPEAAPRDLILPAFRCAFSRPDGSGVAVDCFGLGDGAVRARVYPDQVGPWSWRMVAREDSAVVLAEGTFEVRASSLRGRLLPHAEDPRQWMTENGEWFLNLNDTAYFLLSPVDNAGVPISDETARAYVADAVGQGITSFRSFPPTGNLRLGSHLAGAPAFLNSVYGDTSFREPNLANYATADRRLQMLLDEFPDAYLQFIVLPLGTAWGEDQVFWQTLPVAHRERLLRYLVARFAAFPQLFWLVQNDAHYGDAFPHNTALAREVGSYLEAHDPWQHPRSTGPARGLPFPFVEESWATYVHLERSYDLNAEGAARYAGVAKPVFCGEDRYEQDRMVAQDPLHMAYFQRRLFWSWLLSGGSANYGGRWFYLHPYTRSGSLKLPSLWPAMFGVEGASQASVPDFDAPLVGLDGVPPIRAFFADRALSLAGFVPVPGAARDLGAAGPEAPPKAMRAGAATWLVYHPNAQANGREAAPRTDAARFELDLSSVPAVSYRAEWFHCASGLSSDFATPVEGGGPRVFEAPWPGTDVVLVLRASE